MEETVEISKSVAKRIGDELGIPVYLYDEDAASADYRKNLAIERDNMKVFLKKINDPKWKPDFI